MGNSGSNDVTIEKEDDKYVITSDGIKLSPALLGRMIDQNPNKASSEDMDTLRKKATDAILKEREKVTESERVAAATRELLKDREQQMNDLVETWKERLEEEKKKHHNFYDLTMKEYEEALEKTEKKLKKPSLSPICESFRDHVLACYQQHPKQTLNCSQSVADFTKCVSNAKRSALDHS